jgi:sporulation protein YlmC with PRC-barrel domain
MLQLSNSLLNKDVLSLRTGGPIASITQTIINPNNLKIEGFYCVDISRTPLVLLTQDIRDILAQGVVVNDFEVLTEPGELVRLEKVLRLNFQLIGKSVMTASKQRVGKVSDFATDTSTFYIQKIYVSQSILKSLNTGQLSIDRTQIIEITPKKVVIQDLLKGQKAPLAATSPVA